MPCPLCGEIHALQVHGYPRRCVRNRDTGENERILIIVYLCESARAQGKPYTGRLLPDFLIPHCVIRLDHLVKAARGRKPDRSVDRVCELIGCVDPRTARKHLELLDAVSRELARELAERASSTPELGPIPEAVPTDTSFMRFESLVARELKAATRSADEDQAINPLRLLQAELRNRAEKKTSTCASGRVRPP